MREIWFIRHGETDWNRCRRWQGHTDLALNATGRAQAQRLGERLRGVHFDALYTSDLDRARATAEIALPGTSPVLDARLREMHFGGIEGRTWDEMSAAEQHRLECWGRDPYGVAVDPDAESYTDLESRMLAWIESLPTAGRFAAFTSGGPIRCMLWHIVGAPRHGTWTLALGNAGITRIAIDAHHTSVLTVNDCAHLEVKPGDADPIG